MTSSTVTQAKLLVLLFCRYAVLLRQDDKGYSQELLLLPEVMQRPPAHCSLLSIASNVQCFIQFAVSESNPFPVNHHRPVMLPHEPAFPFGLLSRPKIPLRFHRLLSGPVQDVGDDGATPEKSSRELTLLDPFDGVKCTTSIGRLIFPTPPIPYPLNCVSLTAVSRRLCSCSSSLSVSSVPVPVPPSRNASSRLLLLVDVVVLLLPCLLLLSPFALRCFLPDDAMPPTADSYLGRGGTGGSSAGDAFPAVGERMVAVDTLRTRASRPCTRTWWWACLCLAAAVGGGGERRRLVSGSRSESGMLLSGTEDRRRGGAGRGWSWFGRMEESSSARSSRRGGRGGGGV